MSYDLETEIQSVEADDAQLYRRTPRLTWRDGEGERAVLLTRKLVVGSSGTADVCIADPLVSRVHAEFDLRDDGAWVRDLGSRNGTFVNGIRVEAARVPNRVSVRIGLTDIAVSYDAGETQPVDLWQSERYGRLLGESPAMRELFALIDRVAQTDAPVLIHGETGTGKELIAQAIHDHSPRASKPFVIVDCAALPENLLDAELFGHAKGAFTGAANARAGAFETATEGTVFLDEIGELPVSMQPKLLRVLEAGTIRRLGETQYRKVDVRIVAATHRDLLAMVGRNEFREDLFFRLNVVPVNVPPLRDRREDIPLLVRHFLGENSNIPVDKRLADAIASRAWRGNVRELRNFVQRMRALGPAEALAMTEQDPATQPVIAAAAEAVAVPSAPSLLPPAAQDDAGEDLLALEYRAFRERWIDRGERQYVESLLERHGRNVSAAARAAGVDRTYLHRLIRRHNL
jgi:transcriptional regulator with GAF, ATPase, and Fis domain